MRLLQTSPRGSRSARAGERGQMVPLVAIMATVIIGCLALATDLSVSTHYKRNLQNVTDSAALAGAKMLPAAPALSDEQSAATLALEVVHNSFPWPAGSGSWASTLAGSGCAGAQCSITVCAGPMTVSPAPVCTVTTAQGSSPSPFVLTVNSPPLTAAVAGYNGDPHRVEVYMRQQTSGFFTGVFGLTNGDGARSVAYHFAPNQAFGFALFSRTIIQDGNAGETIAGNVYASRYLAPQSNGQAGICAAPYFVNSVQRQGFIYLGYPQLGDGPPAYQNDGQSSVTHSRTVIDGVTCPDAGGTVGMSANPASTADCVAGDPGNNGGSTLTWDPTDGACEASPPIQPPSVAALPNLPVFSTVCGTQGLSGGVYQPGEYQCTANRAASLVVDHQLNPGIYEIDPGNNTGGCDVTMDGSITQLLGVTFYLKAGAGICVSLPSGVTITQTPYNSGSGAAGDGRYAVLSDNSQSPSITLTSSGQGSTSGIWSISGVIWLPSGSVTINDKTAIEDTGQIIVNTWNDQSGAHQNPSVTYNAGQAPSQSEILQLSE